MAKELFDVRGAEMVPAQGNDESRELVICGQTQGVEEIVVDDDMERDVIALLLRSDCQKMVDKAKRMIHRDMKSHLKWCHCGDGYVYAEIYALDGVCACKCASYYQYILLAHMCPKAKVRITTQILLAEKGGRR